MDPIAVLYENDASMTLLVDCLDAGGVPVARDGHPHRCDTNALSNFVTVVSRSAVEVPA